jgi:hypothetical protein
MATQAKLQVPTEQIADSRRVKAVKLDGMRHGTAIYKRLRTIKPGMSVADVLATTEVSRFDLACHVPRGRVVLGK